MAGYMVFRVFVFLALYGSSIFSAHGQMPHHIDKYNSRVEEFARAYLFCKAIIADNSHLNSASTMNTSELAECAIDISLRELGNTSVDDPDCLRSISNDWAELLTRLRKRKVSDTGIALHLRNYVLNYVDNCGFERKVVD